MPSVWRASTSTRLVELGPDVVAGGGGDELGDAADVEAGHRHPGHAGEAAQVGQHRAQRLAGVGRRGAVGDDDEHVGQALVVDELAEQVDRRPARPVEVVDDHERRPFTRQLGDGADHGAEQPRPLGVGVAVADRQRQPEVGGAPWDEPGELAGLGAEAFDRRLRVDHAEHVVERLGERLVGNGLLLRARAEQDRPAFRVDVPGELGEQPCLAGAGLARNEDDLPGTRGGRRPGVLQRAPRLVAPDEGERVDERQQRWERDRRATTGS